MSTPTGTSVPSLRARAAALAAALLLVVLPAGAAEVAAEVAAKAAAEVVADTVADTPEPPEPPKQPGLPPLPEPLAALWAEWNDPATQAVEPFWIFDNIAYVGIDWVAAYVLKTSEGLIVIDALYGPWVEHLLGGMRKLGLDPADIRYVIVTHGHFDHAGGAAELQRRFGARVVMSREDWALAAQPATVPHFAFDMPDRSDDQAIVAGDGTRITLGDTTVDLMLTPGHSPGVLTLRYRVRDGASTHQAITLGGVGLNFSGIDATETYVHSYRRLLAIAEGIEVSLPNHAAMGGVFERAARLAGRAPGDPHPFVDGEGYRLALQEFLGAGMEKLDLERTGKAPDPVEALRATLAD